VKLFLIGAILPTRKLTPQRGSIPIPNVDGRRQTSGTRQGAFSHPRSAGRQAIACADNNNCQRVAALAQYAANHP
jgi:hypothetical protein